MALKRIKLALARNADFPQGSRDFTFAKRTAPRQLTEDIA